MKTKILMILFLLIGVFMHVYIIAFLKTDDLEVWGIVISASTTPYMFFWITLLYYSYTLGTPIKVIILSILLPLARYFILFNVGVYIVTMFDLMSTGMFGMYLSVTGLLIMFYVIYSNFKYSRSLIFITVGILYVLEIGFGFIRSFDLFKPNSLTASINMSSVIQISQYTILILVIIWTITRFNKTKLQDDILPSDALTVI